jgi:Cu-Zn family superoxide dismutase
MKNRVWWSLALAAVWLGLSALIVSAQATQAYAMLKMANGQDAGTAVFTQQTGGVKMVVNAKGLPAGKHGVHIHAVGKCEGPDFTTAGGHFNPENKQHGAQNPQGAHAGDLPNLTIAANGAGTLDVTNAKITLGTGATSLFDADGSALVIHAAEDDERTDPTGNSGGRIACGVIVAGVLPRTGADSTLSIALIASALFVVAVLAFVFSRKLRATR